MERDEFYGAVGARIREIRKTQKKGQKELAARLNLSRESVSNIEAGRHAIQLHVAIDIAEHLGVSLDDLLPKRSIELADDVSDPRVVFKSRIMRGSL